MEKRREKVATKSEEGNVRTLQYTRQTILPASMCACTVLYIYSTALCTLYHASEFGKYTY